MSAHATTEACPFHTGQDAQELREPFDMHAPDSLTIRTSGDIRSYLVAGRTFLMQVAHPAVGAGVWKFSNFRKDPWHRLRELDKSGNAFTFCGRNASIEEGKRLRRLHKDIQGIDTRGRKYHSLDPQVYGWVHTVFLDSMVTMHRLYGTPLTRAQEEQLFIEWRQAGRMFGLKDKDMPESLDAYWAYYEHMIENELEYTEVVDFMLQNATPPRPPALSRMPKWLWKQSWKRIGGISRTLTLASLPPAYRKKIAQHHPWTEQDERTQQRFGSAVRAIVPRLPERMRVLSQARAATCPV